MIKVEQAKKVGDKAINWYRFENKNGLKMTVTNLGATIVSLKVPDRKGHLADVVLGFDGIEQYIAGSPFFGCTAGRYANRIGGAQFTLNDTVYKLTPNENGNQLHGGIKGFDKQIWDGKVEGDALVLSYVSPDGEEGYPGTLTTHITFRLTDEDAVDISYSAQSDKDTVVNLTNHSYFNLNGAKHTVLEHELTIKADCFTPTDDKLIPTGEIRDVTGTPMDFRTAHKIGDRIFEHEYDAIALCHGYDNNYILNGEGMRSFATLYDEQSGRLMEAFTDQPAVQLYTAQMLEDGIQGHNGTVYGPFYGVCLETQIFPDSPNRPEFTNAVLKPGQTYAHHTRYAFSVK